MPYSTFFPWLRRHRPGRRLWAALALVGVILLFLVWLPGFLRREITARLATATTAEVHIAAVDFNLFRGRLALHGLTLKLKDEGTPVIAVRELTANLRMLLLLRGQVSLEEVALSGLHVVAVQPAHGQLNLTRLFPPSPVSASPPPESDLPVLGIERFSLSAAQIDYQDRALTPAAHFTLTFQDVTIGDITLQAQGLGAPITARFHGSLQDGPLRGEAQVFWQRRQTVVEASLEVQRLALKTLEPYVHDALALQHLSGFTGARLHYRYHYGGEHPPVHALDGSVTLEQLSFADPLSNQTVLDLPNGQVTVESIDLLKHEIRLATAEFHTPKLFFLQSASGLNWTGLVRTPSQTTPAETQRPAAAPTWRFSLREVRVAGGEIVYRDHTWAATETLTVVPEELQIQHLGNETAESPLRFRLRLGEGTVAGEGTLQPTPLHVQTQLQLTGLDLTSLRPVLTRSLAAENMSGAVNGTVKAELNTHNGTQILSVSGVVETTALSLAGVPQPGSALSWESGHIELGEGSTIIPLDLKLHTQLARLAVEHLAQGDVATEKTNVDLRLVQEEASSSEGSLPETAAAVHPSLSIKAQGTLDVANFLLAYGADKQEVLSCYQFRATLNEGSRLLPLDLRLGDVTLEYPYAQGFRTAQGQFQLVDLSSEAPPAPDSAANMASPTAQSPPTSVPSSAALPTVHIDRVTLSGGQLYFEDRAVTPPQLVYWQDVKIDLSDVGYPLVRPAAFALNAFNNDGAPIEIQGTTQRQADLLLTRIHGKVERLSLPRFNSYFESFLGYHVRNGAVSLTWDLTIPGNRLQATTAVTLHNLGLSGKEGTSVLEAQVGLPLQLVIALLKDLNGNINLQLPVAGQLGDPGFHLGGTILRAIRDVLIGAVTSPLKLLGAAFSGGDKVEDFTLEPIRFVPGTSQPDGAGKEQLARLGRCLAQRPEVALQLSGHTGPNDLQILKDRVVLAQLMQDHPPPATTQDMSPEQEGTPPSASPQEEVRQFLAYQLDHAQSTAGPALSPQAATLLGQLREQVTISQQARDRLAQDRLQAVITSLTANRGVTQERLRLSPEKLRSREGSEVRYIVQAKTETEGR
jgi:uncharacterized protein involved in outer membrane biogenesis